MRTTRRTQRTRCGAIVCLVVIFCAASGGVARAISRDDEPVVVSCARFPELAGTAIADGALFVWDTATSSYVPTPFQIDERVVETFNPGTPLQFTQLMHDVFHRENGTFDDDDELVFLFRDARLDRAPAQAPWPAGAGEISYELAVEDPRRKLSGPARYAYLFVGAGLAQSPVSYVSWSGSEASPVSTVRMTVDFAGRWLVNGLSVAPPCGSGTDLIDRVKGRARPLINQEEDEEGWNVNSSWLGGVVGPVRAIRYVRGATSGINTILHDEVYRDLWIRHVDLRVHPLDSVRMYVDWLPGPGRTAFFPNVTSGVPVDGVADSVSTQFAEWMVMRTPSGGAGVVLRGGDVPQVANRRLFYRDDKNWDDRIAGNPAYSDDDNAAYGDSGIEFSGVGNSNVTAIPITFRVYPLCANDGSAVTGSTINELEKTPLEIESTPRFAQLAAVRTLAVQRQGDDVSLGWTEVENAEEYVVYASPVADLPHTSWTVLGSVVEAPFVDGGAAADPAPRFYSVVARQGGEEGGW